MHWDRLRGTWNQGTGEVTRPWGKLTDDDLHTVEGDRQRLVGTIQERYGGTKEEADRQVDAWLSSR
ncbi:MAG: CsbD family protein [Deinococcus-Thermus bacterium]|jgi:uncharacterized protein YjbJ (UPF0337 family)|nr:CsbD family protein [Deinococcota bacterium]